jgi:predicted TIM-barrel fold metal-dependent hydrolase
MTVLPFPIIDAHHHIWRQQDLPWLTGPMAPRIFGPYEPIRRDYPMAEFRAEAEAAGVTGSIYVQTNWTPDQCVEEVAWVESVARETDWPHAIVGFCDLHRVDAPAVLDTMLAASPRLRGIRQQMHWHDNPQYRFAQRPDTMNEPLWRKNLAAVAERGLVFELQVFMAQADHAASLVAAFPELTFMLTHAGMPEDLTSEGMAHWRTGLAQLAAYPNVATKLSGFGTFIHRNDPAHVTAIIQETVALFGPERCLFGSNFPIEKLWTDYATLLATHLTATEALPTSARAAIFGGTAARVYRAIMA